MHPRPDTGCIYGNKKGQDHAAHFIIRYFEVFKTLLPQKLPQHSFQITAGRVCFFCLSFFCGRQLLFGLFLFILCVFVMLSGCPFVFSSLPAGFLFSILNLSLVFLGFPSALSCFLSGFGGSGFTLLSEETGLFLSTGRSDPFLGVFSFGGTAGLSSTAPSSTSNMFSYPWPCPRTYPCPQLRGLLLYPDAFLSFWETSQFFGSGFLACFFFPSRRFLSTCFWFFRELLLYLCLIPEDITDTHIGGSRVII